MTCSLSLTTCIAKECTPIPIHRLLIKCSRTGAHNAVLRRLPAMVVPGRPPESVCATAKPGFGRRLCGRDLAEARRDARGAGAAQRPCHLVPGGDRGLRGRALPRSDARRERELGAQRAGGRGPGSAAPWPARGLAPRRGRRGKPPAILRRYLALAPGARAHIPIDRHAPLEQFERIAPQIPVFRITIATSRRTCGLRRRPWPKRATS